MFIKRTLVALALPGLLLACSASPTEAPSASTDSAYSINPNLICESSQTTQWLDPTNLNWMTQGTINPWAAWHRTGMTSSGPLGGTYVAYAAESTFGAGYVVVWVPQNVSGNFEMFNGICSSGGGSGVPTPEPSACFPYICYSAQAGGGSGGGCGPRMGPYVMRVNTSSAPCLTRGMVNSWASQESCATFYDSYCQ